MGVDPKKILSDLTGGSEHAAQENFENVQDWLKSHFLDISIAFIDSLISSSNMVSI